MGMDQYALTRKKNRKDTRIMQWRREYRLEKWMSRLYYAKGGMEESFNRVELSLSKEDLLRLKDESRDLPDLTGALGGVSDSPDLVLIEVFIESAIQAADDGYEIIYTSCW